MKKILLNRFLLAALFVVVLSLPLTAVRSAMAHPWAMFQGDSRHTGRSLYPGPRQDTIAFKYELHGITEGAPVVADDGTIYVASHTGKISAFYPSGQKKWEFETFCVIRATPLIGPDNTIYVGSRDGGLYALNQDGTLKWVYLTHDQILSSPVLSQDGTTIYTGVSGKGLLAIGVDGKLKWNTPLDVWITAPSPAIGNNGVIYIGGYGLNGVGGKVFGINPDGTIRWGYATPGAVRTTPAIADDGTIYVGTRGGELYAFSPEGTVKWIFTARDEIRASAAIDPNGTIYVGSYDKTLYAINPNGTVKWTFPLEGHVEVPPIIDSEGVIFVAAETGEVYMIGRGGAFKGKLLGLGLHHSALSIGSNGTLYIAGDFNLSAVGPLQPIVVAPPINPIIEVLTEKSDYYLGDTLTVDVQLTNPTQENKPVEVKVYMRDSSGKTTSLVNVFKTILKPNTVIKKRVYSQIFDGMAPTSMYWIDAKVLVPETGDSLNQDFKTISYTAY